jgi:type IV secretory pathway component VirB8
MLRPLLRRIGLLRDRVAAAQEVVARQKLGEGYPRNVDSGHEQRRRDRVERALVVALVASLGVNAVQGALNHALFAQQRYDIVMVQTQPETRQVVTLLPVRWGVPGGKVAAEGWLRSYVEYRHALAPDRAEMDRRIAWIRNRSAANVFEEYRAYNTKIITDALTNALTRFVEIRSVSELAEGYYQIDFRVTDSEKGRPCPRAVCTGDWRALARVAFEPKQFSREELRGLDDGDASMKLGFTVYSYGVAPISGQQAMK